MTTDAFTAVRKVAIVAACLVMLSACRVSGLSFVQDTRLEIVSPRDRATVTLPFDVRWTVEDFDAGYFAVLLDVSPMPPGEGLGYFTRDDRSCRPEAGCPDSAYLADRNIHLTDQTSFEVTSLLDTRPTERPGSPDNHEITIVLLNEEDERIGESAFRIRVTVDREAR